jgi:Fe-S oxidoreductase
MWLIRAWLNEEVQNSRKYWDILYSCVTCGNCKAHCIIPSLKDALLNIFEAAKAEQVSYDLVPPVVGSYFKAIQSYGNPYKEPQDKRSEWAEGAGIEAFRDQEYLFYVGDVGSYDELGKKMAKSVATLLCKSGLSIGFLGDKENSDGNDVKTLGGRELFQKLSERNIKTFNKNGIKKIITLDPHAFHTFTHDYPKMGGDYKVWHYTQILAGLIKEKKLPISQFNVKVTYHDSCYLGRHNSVYNAPRTLLAAIPGLELVEMSRNKANALCCAGGGGNFFTDFLGSGGDGPAGLRIKEALDSGAEIVAVACPMCSKMLDDAIKDQGMENRLSVQDVAEIVNQAMPS